MGRIFISAAGGKAAKGLYTGSIAGNINETREMILLRDLIVTELRAQSCNVLAVPDDLSATESIAWINSRSCPGDVALEIHAQAAISPTLQGAGVHYIADNQERQSHGELLLLKLLGRVTRLANWGVKPDTDSCLGSLPFCRQIIIPSLLMQVGFLSSPEDCLLLQNYRRDFALGIAEGLISWSRLIDRSTVNAVVSDYPVIDIHINGQKYGEKGILVNGNCYIPINIVDQLQIDLLKLRDVHRITYHRIVYIKAVDLREFHVQITWDTTINLVTLRSNLLICVDQIDRIMSRGNTSEVELQLFLKSNHEKALVNFSQIAQLYREEGKIEGVNYDIAFCQMCLETEFLRFGGDVRPEQNNFAGLGCIGGSVEAASFPSARIGVRAHIQHLKAYGSLEPLVTEVVDPRFRFITRGIAPSIYQLSGRWSADLDYGTKILAIMKRLYTSAQIL
ncbi:glucosaminidase domain-containing protein [Anabaenopsis sp. FSS-46]|uniref:hormogonium tapered terminus morphoprotein TftA n=1 Tax=Anabaenopsis sp. FSS-46 TaxID=2971766 RepID=UPI0024760717|nr:N-acetylmuramoyl-L-alanine amidase [Anabaenopsis sp. FSS-46]MDH6099349.1 glucosaminidase domain-containing protein [Anabaenopsis sp. FSS-46]